ncbi:hypothetical protein C1701_01835 [Actinoalloteichus sp. AHMU CJ021]|uniref:SHOCT domain-containing protein n=1 Tax=Actinoalloteichus sp. AHMU CJ021 TaxID=2072503 RepID=UPI000CA007E9|nr:hypothetical protein C1701_01835 [Actinoalloteichus sp. AHMU CJ021]
MYYGPTWGPGPWIFFVVLLLLIVAIALSAFLVRRGVAGGTSGAHRADGTMRETGLESARRILDERFARGEINEEEYRRRRHVIRDDGTSPGD